MPGRENDQDRSDVKRRRFLQGTGAGAIAVGMAGCTGGPTPTETGTGESTPPGGDTTETTPTTPTGGGGIPEGGTFTYGLPVQPETSNVTQSGTVYSAVALGLCYSGPIAANPSTDLPEPWLYTDWTLEDSGEGPVGKTAYFNMRNDVKFGNGDDVTADDVLFTYDYLVENNVAEYASVNSNIASDDQGSPRVGEASNDFDFRAVLEQEVVAWQFSTIGAIDILPKSYWEGTDPQQATPFEDDAVYGMGPGKLTTYNPSTSMQVQIQKDQSNYKEVLNNQDWVQENELRLAGGPFMDQFNFQVFGSESAMTNAFLEGDIDTHYGSVSTARLSEVRNTEGIGVVNGPDSGFSGFQFNLLRQPFDDLCFRQAAHFMWDHVFWVETLQNNTVLEGDYAITPGYPAARPETYNDAELLTAPESNLFRFRQNAPGVPNVEAVRNFLTSGQVEDGSGGTVAGMDYPGGFYDDISASQSSAKYNYSFGPVESEVLQDANADQEIRINGQTLPEFKGGENAPFTILNDPPAAYPRQAKAINTWVQNLRQVGIPAEVQILNTNTLYTKLQNEDDFDCAQHGWAGSSPYGASSYFFFHSNFWSEDPEVADFNFGGYGVNETGADEMILDAYTTLDTEEASRKFARVHEKVYLDGYDRVSHYARQSWPMNTSKFDGYVQGVVGPTYASWFLEANNLYLAEG